MNIKKKIFITEDEFIVSKNLESKLVALGYDVIGTAPSGEIALQKISENQPDLVLMDIMLAGEMDGIDTAKIIREMYDLPIIFLTAYSSQEIYRRAALTEPYAYIIKPFEERELEINIAIALYKHNMEREFQKKQIELEELNENLDRLIEERTQNLIKEISERKKAQELQQRFYNIIEQTSDHVLITDTEGVIEYANPAMINFTGYSKSEFIGAKPSILKSGIYDDQYYRDLWEKITKGIPFHDEIINKKKNGDIYTSAQTIIPLKDNENKISRFASISRDYTKKKEFEKKLMDVQEEERARISKELHDGIGQSVAAIKLGLGSLLNSKDKADFDFDTLGSINTMVEELTSSIRETSYSIMPSVLRDYGLIPALNKTIAILEKTTPIDINMVYGEVKDRTSNDIELTLFRIAQEALTNSIKHSEANRIDISLDYSDKIISLRIQDDGNGFDENESLVGNVGQGLPNMKHRAFLLDGTFKIKSNKNIGTVINVKIPYGK